MVFSLKQKNRSLELRFVFLFPLLHCSPLSAEKAVSMNTKATGGHGIGSPCKPEGTREAGGLPGEKTFGDFWSFKSHSPQPEGQAKPLRGQGPRLFDAEPHQPDWRVKEVSPLTLALSHKGRGDQSADHRGLSRAQRLKKCRGKRHKQKPQP